jgi:hypothetical protein
MHKQRDAICFYAGQNVLYRQQAGNALGVIGFEKRGSGVQGFRGSGGEIKKWGGSITFAFVPTFIVVGTCSAILNVSLFVY